MVPVINCSVGNITLLPGSTCGLRKEIQSTRCHVSGKYLRPTPLSQGFLFTKMSLRLFQRNYRGYVSKHGSRVRIFAAVGADITIEEPDPAVSDEVADETSETAASSAETNEPAPANPAVTSTAKSKRPRPVRKSEMPPVKDEELVPGASFKGKVRSIQPFGAFVDFGAFTNGLVHVSRLSDEYVKDVASFVSVGQEVTVRIVEVNKESGRISLTMRDTDEPRKIQQRRDTPADGSNNKPRAARKNAARSNQKDGAVQKISKFVKGQNLVGTVKNITRSGAFVSLPAGEEGFLPISEESEGFGGILGNSSLQVGQEVKVRVLRVTRGQVTLTMKKEEDVERLNIQLNQGVVHVATNPFELAFRKNKEIAAFLDERERDRNSSENLSMSKTLEQAGGDDDEAVANSNTLEVDGSTASSDENQVVGPSDLGDELEDEKGTVEELREQASVEDPIPTDLGSKDVESASTQAKNAEIVPETVQEDVESSKTSTEPTSDSVLDEASVTDDVQDSSAAKVTAEEQNLSSKASNLGGGESSADGSAENLLTSVSSITSEGKEESANIKTVKKSEGVLVSESTVASVTNEAREADVTTGTVLEDETDGKTLSAEENEPSVDSAGSEKSSAIKDSSINVDSSGEIGNQKLSSGVLPDEVVTNQSDDTLTDEKVEKVTPMPVVNEEAFAELKEAHAEASEILNGQATNPDQESASKVGAQNATTISAALVKQLREETGAGMMDCKKALAETGGDIVKAQEFLRKKGLASAEKKASRATAEGRIGSYIHDNRIGVLIEVNCETDFVSRGEIFKELVDDLAMQVAACPQVRYLVIEDVPEEIVNKERELEMQKEDLLTKPENIRSKIVDGRIRKRLEEFSLLEQPYIKNDKIIVKDWVKQTIASIGENIKVRRFVRYNLGEGLEKKSQDFAAEVAAQTAAKPSPEVPVDQPSEAKEAAEKPPTVAVSAALVKQLREETGAGMMDCKKALTETGGNLEKAQEYLRKKGLSSADKKSSRLAAEGLISSYIHDSRIGVLIEVNCETDFVGRNEKFKQLVDDLAMQVVACPQVEFVSIEDIPEHIVQKEKEIEMQREDLKSKPEHIREKIVEGRIGKRLGELALLEQPFIKDDTVLVKDLVKQTVSALGENIKVRRFVRYTLGESKD
ncbi:polyprotein of EF-Ts, chloroplastic [Elaeis guineensis]|uniref:Elongation factor Ts, mitochondrial n=1 Tax=Elaeis guineensis var. tenera TaxID=51953 RepID=A0A6I9S4W3_ELAGV|nr:uncharacterized protein LOC105056625 [Elaeis guineensis]XP_019710159.1 uncharacterized protein LOC105056625 [Elaeis guineensis]